MERIRSTEFQKAYPRLTEPHEVTALGRVIGTWYPVGTGPLLDPSVTARSRVDPDAPNYNSRPFTPAPKPGRKK